jgi:hypothetical protein
MRQFAGRVRCLDLLPITCEDLNNEVRKGSKLVGHYLLAEISYQRKSQRSLAPYYTSRL